MFLNTKENRYILEIQNNSELNCITKTIKYFIDNLKNNSAQILNTLNRYSKQNYVETIYLTYLSGYFKSLGKEVHSLQETIAQMIINNQQNGRALHNNSEVHLKNRDIFKKNSNDAMVVLTETSIAIEEATKNIFTNTKKIIKMAHLAETVTNVAISEKALANKRTTFVNEIDDEINSIIKAITIIHKIASRTHDAVVDIDTILKLIVSNGKYLPNNSKRVFND